ncbi:FAD-dependent monooxygenase [Pseudomonas chlororaphis]|uniref:FAD-dependent monooxygenase n=1 Tax=Pseudomonas chlororaphis TaxID=587753 RepID=UPI0004B250BB|nr:FAD-dependent monooxygenase [Pseudomonas chlororaphis]
MSCHITIVGAGIAGLTLALALHARGIKNLTILERSASLKEAGSGLNILPLATRELAALDLLPELEGKSILLDRLNYTSPDGEVIWSEPKGRAALFSWPQLSISRAKFCNVLLKQVRQRLGEDAIIAGAAASQIKDEHRRLVVFCEDGRDFKTDMVVGADGIRSQVRRFLFPELDPMRPAPFTVYRGIVRGRKFSDNRTMYIAGDGICKFVVYPLLIESSAKDIEINWAAALPDELVPKYPFGKWNVPADAGDISSRFRGWSLDGLLPDQIIQNTMSIYAYPLVDIEPLKNWSNKSNVVLIGDAAHGMYPIGSNGATQSIIDAVSLAHCLASFRKRPDAIAAFEADRVSAVQAIQLANREKGPEVVIDVLAERRRTSESSFEDLFPHEERLAIAERYAQLTNVTRAAVNGKSPYMWGRHD